MSFYPTDRLALFIDGANLYSASKALSFDIDYRKLLDEFRRRGVLMRAYYYTAIVEDQEYSPIRPLVDWLDYNGFAVVTKSVRRYTEPGNGATRIKGDMDVEIAVDMMELSDKVDHMVSTVKSQPPMASDDLRRQADAFVELNDLANIVGRPRQNAMPRVLNPEGGERPERSRAESLHDDDYDDD
jgi:uncharacterized LabA/DUF88 family protein